MGRRRAKVRAHKMKVQREKRLKNYVRKAKLRAKKEQKASTAK